MTPIPKAATVKAMTPRRWMVLTGCALSLCWHLANPDQAGAVLVYATDFESPTSVPGQLVGQDGWYEFFTGLSVNAATVSTELPNNGSQSAKIDGELVDEWFPGFYAAFYSNDLNYDTAANGTASVEVEANLNLAGTFAAIDSCQGGIAISLDGILFGIGAGTPQTGTINYFIQNQTGDFAFGPAILPSEWGHVRAVFDYDSRTVRGYFNDEFIAKIPFDAEMTDVAGRIDLVMVAPIFMNGVTSYVDDVVVMATPAFPSTSAWGAIAMAILLTFAGIVGIMRTRSAPLRSNA